MKNKIILSILFIVHGAQCVSMGCAWTEISAALETSLSIGHMATFFTVASIVAAVVASKSQKYKTTVFIGIVLMALSSTIYTLMSNNFYPFIAATVIAGLSSGFMIVGINSYIKSDANVYHGLWMAGAGLMPLLLLRSNWGMGNIILVALLLLVGIAFLFSKIEVSNEEDSYVQNGNIPKLWFMLLAFCLVGADATFGKYITTYGDQIGCDSDFSKLAASGFFFGILISRMIFSFFGKRKFLHIILGTLSLVLMIILDRDYLIVLSFSFGFGIGPMFPYILTMVSGKSRGFVQTFANLGAFMLPLIATYSPFLLLLLLAMTVIAASMGIVHLGEKNSLVMKINKEEVQ